MKKTSTTIEINGRRYDANSGALLDEAAGSRPAARTIDGMVGRGKAVASVHTTAIGAPAKPKPATPASIVKQPVMDIARPAAKKLQHRTPRHSQTLMRGAVHKPDPSLKRHVKAQGPLATVAHRPAHEIALKLSANAIDTDRERRAAHTPKNQLVSRFNRAAAAESADRPNVHIVRPAAAQISAAATAAPASTAQPSMDIFERAIARATAHEQPPVVLPGDHRTRRFLGRRATVLVSTLAIVILGGFLIHQNTSRINLFLASGKAGFQATLPNYNPAGYGLAKMTYAAGVVAVQYHSNSDDRAYTVTEKTSDWDSATLLQTFIASVAGKNYQTVQSGGNTIYLYGKFNATWVSGGIWYQIQSNGSLSDQQLVQLATSM